MAKNITLFISNPETTFQVSTYQQGENRFDIYINKENYTADDINDIINGIENYEVELIEQDTELEYPNLHIGWSHVDYDAIVEEELEDAFHLTFVFNRIINLHERVEKNTTDIEYIAIMSDIELE